MPRPPRTLHAEHWDDDPERHWSHLPLGSYSPSSTYPSPGYPSQYQSNRDKELVPYNPSPTHRLTAYPSQHEGSSPGIPSLSYSSPAYHYTDESYQDKVLIPCKPFRTYSASAYPYHNNDTQDKRYLGRSSHDREIRYRYVAPKPPLIPPHYLDSISNGYQFLLCLVKIFSSRLGQRSFAGKDWGNAHRTPEFSIVEGHWDRRKIMSADHREVRMPQQRQDWEVSIVYNTWTLVKERKLNRPLKQLLAHWGVCFAPSSRKGLNRVYSMDFEDELGLNLVLQNTWWTPEDGWVQETYDDEMHIVERKYRSSSATMYFSEAELAVTAQRVLDEFLRYHYDTKTMKALQKGAREFEKHCKKYHLAWNAGTGRLYDLLSRNCQDYATYLFDNLLYQGWDDKKRLDRTWDPQVWLQDSDYIEWLEVPRSKRWGRIGRVMKELTQAATEGGAKAYVVFMLLYELRELF